MLKPGYKQTDLGVLPEEWEVKPLGQLAHIKTGKKNNDDKVEGGKYPFFVRSQHVEEIDSYSFDGEAILLPGEGNIGSIFHYINGKFDYHQRVYKVSNFAPGISGRFIYYYMAQNFGAHAATNTVKATVDSLRLPTFQEFTIALPPANEQQNIATALSAVDELLNSKQQLLTKKRALKLATQQALLSGKQRLPGFAGDWKLRILGEVIKIKHGKSQHSVVDENGRYPILATGGIIGRTNSYLCDKPSVLIGRKGTIDSPQYMDQPFWTVDTLFYTEIIGDNSPKFIFYTFQLIDWYFYNEASGVPSLNASTIEKIEVKFPSPAEQRAIAAILSDMDAEIEALAAQLAKTQALKQGMMQDLLTGTIRLAAGAAPTSTPPTP